MVPTTTTEGTGTTDAANGTHTATGANTGATTPAATIPQASTNTSHGNTPHGSITPHGNITPHGKNPNGSTLVMPRPLDATGTSIESTGIDAGNTGNAHANATSGEGFMSSQMLHLKQQLELANKTIANNRALMKKYDIDQDHDIDFIEKAFESNNIDPSNTHNTTTGNPQNTTTVSTRNSTGKSPTTTTTAAINGSGNSINITTARIPNTNTNPYSKRSSNGTNDTNGSNANPNNSIDLTTEEANQKSKAKPPTNLSKVIEPHSSALK